MMSNQTISLTNKCPKCGSFLYAYSHTPASDHPELTAWHIECNRCDYQDPKTYITPEELLGDGFEQVPQEIVISNYWPVGDGRSVLRDGLPADHPENTYNWFIREYPDLDPTSYGIYKTMTTLDRQKAIENLYARFKDWFAPERPDNEFIDDMNGILDLLTKKKA